MCPIYLSTNKIKKSELDRASNCIYYFCSKPFPDMGDVPVEEIRTFTEEAVTERYGLYDWQIIRENGTFGIIVPKSEIVCRTVKDDMEKFGYCWKDEVSVLNESHSLSCQIFYFCGNTENRSKRKLWTKIKKKIEKKIKG